MSVLEIILIGVGLAMDAFAVSICKGLATKEIHFKHYLIAGIWFGGFQAVMPLIGYTLGTSFQNYIEAVDHWIAFALLGVIGVSMIKESMSNDDEDTDDSFAAKTMLVLAVATSIDALAVGITFAVFKVEIIMSIIIIGIITFAISSMGIKIGSTFGIKYKSNAEMAGGLILILIGIKILLEHLSIISV